MGSPINKILASTAQAFSTAEQKQARDNISAQAKISYSYSGSTITAIDGSAVGNPAALTGVDHDGNLSGAGTQGSPLGLRTSITLTQNGDSATLAYDHLKLTYRDNDPILSASNGTIYMSGHAGNASSPYTASYDIQGMSIYGTDTYNHITATAKLQYSGAEFHQGTDSANIKATGLTLHTNSDGDQLVDASSVVRWNGYSSLSGFTGCSTNNCISGDGTSGSPIGLRTSITLTQNGGSATLAYDQLKLTYSDNDPIISASNGTIYMSGHAGNASSPYTASYDIQGMSIYGTDTYNHITATAKLQYSGAEFQQGADSANIKASGIAFSDGTYSSDIGPGGMNLSATPYTSTQYRVNGWSIYSTGNATHGREVRASCSGLMLDWDTHFYRMYISASGIETYDGWTPSRHHASYTYTGAQQSSYDGKTSIWNETGLIFKNSASGDWRTVDISAIDLWNSYSAGLWNESGNMISTGYGGNPVTAASQFNSGAGNWSVRRIKISGTPDQDLIGFQTLPPAGTGSYQINANGAFVAPDLPTFNLKVYKPTYAPIYLSTSDYPQMPSTADGLLVLVNLGSGTITYPDSDGATSTIGPHNSANLFWDHDASAWVG